MQLIYITTFMFHKEEGETWGLPSCSDSFFGKYLDVFDSVRVIGEEIKGYLNKSALVKMKNTDIEVCILPKNTRPQDFTNDRFVRKRLEEEIAKAEAILIKPSSRRGMMAIKIAEKLNKPYMIEMTGDIYNALVQSLSWVKRMYAPLLYKQITKAIRKCEFGLYVSQDYLQKKYPIKGTICGCSDVVLEKSDTQVLQSRFQKIDWMKPDDVVNLALIGFYQGNGKGVDTALRAISRLPVNFQLSVLGNGTEENRQKWYAYAKVHGVSKDRLHFPSPLSSPQEVLHWLDDYDFFVFPTRSEGLPRVLVEAMSRGLPCFATNICTIPELLPAECLFELDDDKKLAELLLSYYQDKALMKYIANVNFEHSKDYDAEILTIKRNAFLTEFRNYCEVFKEEANDKNKRDAIC